MKERQKILVVGWDGATFDMIEPLVAAGRLPNVARLMQSGAWGRMESTIPALTPTAWTSLSTGVNPGKHAIFDAMLFSSEKRKISFVNASMRKVKPVWSLLSAAGKRVGVMNVPVTYPPDEVDGFVIPGLFTPEGAPNFMYPQELENELAERFGPYAMECRSSGSPAVHLKSILSVEVSFREKIASYLMDKYEWDFFFCAFMSSDRVQHFFWKYLDPAHPDHKKYGDAIATVYEKMDEALGRLLEKAGENATVIMVSDHGSGPLKTAFFLNYWLQQNGYLFLNREFSQILKGRPVLGERLASVLKKLFSARTAKTGVTDAHRDDVNRFPSMIDWERTVAFSEGVGGGLFINAQVVGQDRYESTIEAIREGLLEVRDDHGSKVVKAVYRRDEVYHGEYTRLAPDLIVICEGKFQIIAPNEFLFYNKGFDNKLFLSHRWSGRHEQHGICIIKGPATAMNTEMKKCRIIDIAPTILYLMDQAVPGYMDGTVLNEAIDPAYLEKHPVRYTADMHTQESQVASLSEDEDRKISEKLRDLGYIE
jgi:predicted AlkP superfamily phosphohydrolase/phosphomutase